MKPNYKRLNFVDLLLILLTLSVISIFMIIYFNNSSKVDLIAKETVTLTLRVRNIPIKHASNIKNGDNVYLTTSEEHIGTVKYVSYDNETVEFLDKLTNTSTIYKSPDKKTALVLVDVKADLIDGDYYVGDQKLLKGNMLEAFVPLYSFSSTIVNIDV